MTSEKIRWFVWMGCILSVFVFIFIYCLPKYNKHFEEKYHNFHRKKIDGYLNYVDPITSYKTSFKIAGDTNTYRWLVMGISDMKGKEFRTFVRVGDHISKENNSDTIVILKNDRKYFFRISL